MVRVWACPNSQHSKWKVVDAINPKFPNLSDYISVLYGNYFDAPLDTNLTKFDKLSLTDLYVSTQPEMVVLRVKPHVKTVSKSVRSVPFQHERLSARKTRVDKVWLVPLL